MSSVTPPLAIELQPASAPAQPTEPGPAAKAAEQRIAEHAAMLRADMKPDRLLVHLDENAGRFVQTLLDANSAETLRRYPSEAQLAYSRAIMAYLRAQIGK